MYLVGNDHSPALFTNIRYPTQLFDHPYTSARIMGITKDKQPASPDILRETLKINMIMPVVQIERRIDHFASQTFGYQEKRMVHRRHYHDLVARFGKALQRKCLPAYNSGNKRQHITRNIPLVALVQPTANRGIPLLTGKSISQNLVVETTAQRIHHKRRRTEIHIGHPHGKQIFTSPHILHAVPFYGVRTAAFNHFIKIILHKVQAILIEFPNKTTVYKIIRKSTKYLCF